MSGGYVTAADSRAAASLLLLRDGPGGLEVLMMRRAERGSDPRSGAAVFPGGVVDARDRGAHDCVLGDDDLSASTRLGLASGGLDYAIAAVRETFEEVGLLLAAPADGSSTPPDLAALQSWRERLQQGTASIADMCRAHGLKLNLRGLAYTAHWLTPPGPIKRFDTRFFTALAPAGQQAVADLGEAAELMWLTPAAALAEATGLKLLPVTRHTLQELGRHASAAAAMDAARALPHVPLVMPRRAHTPHGPGVVMPWQPAYAEIGRLDPEGRADQHSDLLPGRVVRLSPRILRITAPNPGPMTGPGTNSYLVGEGERWFAIDPGPVSEVHLAALLAAAPGRIEAILVTHTHRDHSPGAVALAAATGAPVWGLRPAHAHGQDDTFAPARELDDGELLPLGPGTTLQVLHTPGHASNHLCYLLREEKLLFTGDHVMQGSTVVINPPDGDMAVYLASLQALLSVDLQWLAPGHGFLVGDPHGVLRALVAHRLKREAKVQAALSQEPSTLEELVLRAYDDVPPALHGVAQRSLLAHLRKLQSDGLASESAGRWALQG